MMLGPARLVSIALVLSAAGALHVARAQPLEPLLACRAVAAPTERLACFDRESAALAPALAPAPASPPTPGPVSLPTPAPASSPAPAPVSTPAPVAPATVTPVQAGARPVPPNVLSPVESFGLTEAAAAQREVSAGTRAAALPYIDARLTQLTSSPSGLLVFTLDNGQVWKQLAHEGELLARVGDSVRIARGWLGSYSIRLPTGRSCKVARVR